MSKLNVDPAVQQSILAQIGMASNPNQSEEIAICQQIMIAATGNPALVSAIAVKLATETGIPPAAASLALTLGNAGVDIPTRVMQIEQIIKG
jgi:hypothetical protein